jgi:hypothetical protein
MVDNDLDSIFGDDTDFTFDDGVPFPQSLLKQN